MKINIRKCLLACMASMTLISFTAYGSETVRPGSDSKGNSGTHCRLRGYILDKIQEGAPWRMCRSWWRI